MVLFDDVGVMRRVVQVGHQSHSEFFQEPFMLDIGPSGEASLFHWQILINLIMDPINRTSIE